MRHFIILDMASYLADFKPTHIADGFASSTDRVVHRVFDAGRRGTNQLDLFVDVVTHEFIQSFRIGSSEHIPRFDSIIPETTKFQVEEKHETG